ncbi:MAG: AsmA family protein, partial [Thermoanaerobaculia bacterium]
MTARGHKKTHRIRRVLLAVAGGLLLLLIAFVIAGLWRLKKGPVSLASFIPKLEQALSREIAPLSVEIEDVTLSFAGWRSPLDLSAQEVSIIQTSGDELVRLEELGIELSFEPLLHGELAPSKIDARGLAISVVRDEDGTFELDLGGTGSSGTQTGLGLGGWLDQWLDSAATPSVLSELDRISVSQGTLELADKALGRTFKAADIDLELSREPTGLEATLDGKLGLGDGSVEVCAAASFPRQERRLSGRVELDGLQPSMLAWTGKVPECLQSLDPTIYARAELRFGKGFDLAAADFDLTADKLQA